MHAALARLGLLTFEAAREAAGERIGGDAACISRASCARAGGISDVQLWKGLSGQVASRPATAAAAAAGLLIRIIEKTGEEVRSVSTSFQGEVEQAAQQLAHAVSSSCATPDDANARRRLKARLERLDAVLEHTVFDHHPIEKAIAHMTRAWLRGERGEGLKLGLVGAAIAIVNTRPLAQREEVAHA